MTTSYGRMAAVGSARELILAQGTLEKAFPQGEEACTERVELAKADARRAPFDDGFSMKRGIVTGALAEQELLGYATEGCLTVDLGTVVDEILSSTRLGALSAERVGELRSSAITWVRGWQSRVPPEDGDLDWSEVESLLKPQTDLFVRRPGKFAIRVRPDNVAGIGTTLVAVEWSTAKDPSSISPARFALNHHALIRERLRRSEWGDYQAVVTRVEMLALGYGFTVRLSSEEAERWRLAIGKVAEALMEGRHEKNVGPHCSTCFWQPSCWFSDDQRESF